MTDSEAQTWVVFSLCFDFQLANAQERVQWFDVITSLEVLSPLLLDGLDDLALRLLNDCGLDRVVFGGDVGLSFDSVILGSEFFDLVQLDNISQFNILEAIQDNDVVLGD